MAEKFAVYSLPDVTAVLNHPNVGQCYLSETGGQISIAHAGEMSSHTQTAGGYTVVNKLKNDAGTVTVEIPQNSDSDIFLRKWCKYLKNAKPALFAISTLTVTDAATGRKYSCSGVTPQKWPDTAYGQASQNVQYALLCAEIIES